MRVEKKIRMAVACKVFVQGEASCKDEALRVSPPCGCFATQVGGDLRVVFKQPQYAAVDVCQQAHPDVEDVRRDLEVVVEAAEDEAFFRQAVALRS